MGFRDLFKVRKPGNGDKVQKGFESAARSKVSVSNKTSSTRNGGDKKSIGR